MKIQKVTAASLFVIMLQSLLANVSLSNSGTGAITPAFDYIPIKWGLVVLGGFGYGAHPPGANAIQKTEHWIQSEGVPYDVIEDDNIITPDDISAVGKYPLQYSNGTIRYGVLVIIMNDFRDSTAINVDRIYWAVGNGTNVVIFGEAAKYVPKLLNITANDVSYFIDYSLTEINYSVLRGFSDGVEKFPSGDYSIVFPNHYTQHANITQTTGKTIWYTCKADTGEYWIGMMNATYGLGTVFWNSNIPSVGSFFWYSSFPDYWNAFKIVAHSINFMFEQVKRIDLGLQGYKKWRGAITYRLDQDYSVPLTRPDEEALKAGWYVDMVTSALGYLTTGGNLSDGIPSGYIGAPSTTAKWGTFNPVVSTEPYLVFTSRNFTIYHIAASGDYDRMKVDWNENQDFTDDKEYGIWENQTDPSVMGKYFWSYIDNFTNPQMVRLTWWCTLRERISDFTWWKEMGQQGYIRYGFHGFKHAGGGTASFYSDYVVWNGTRFIFDQTWIKEKFTAARDELAYCLGSKGYGFEANKSLVSHGGNDYRAEVDTALYDLSWVYLIYGDNAKNEPGWFLYDGRKAAMTCGAGQGRIFTASGFEALKDAVKTLFPIFGVYEHNWGYYNLTFDVNPSDTAYSDMFCFAHLDDSFEFWSNARYMWRNTLNAFYENNKIVLEYKANSTSKDYVWRFPIVCNGRYFNGFSDSRAIGKIKHIDGKYVYIEFSEGGNDRIEAIYGSNPHIYQTSSYQENITESFAPKNLTLQLWSIQGSVDVKINCTRYGQPDQIKVEGTKISSGYESCSKISSFNVTFNGTSFRTVELTWEHAPPDPPTLISPRYNSRFDPGKSVEFTWRFSDQDVDDSQEAYRFQISKNYVFTSLLVDTGKVVSTSIQVVQALPQAVGSYYWRVTTWDGRDTEGEWSQTQRIIVDKFKVDAKGHTCNRTNVGAKESVCFHVSREYDNSVFDITQGTIYINGSTATWDEATSCWRINVTQEYVGETSFVVSGITDQQYGVMGINDFVGGQQIIWDQLTVRIMPESTSVVAGTEVHFAVTAVYAYDNKTVSNFIVNISRDGAHFASGNFTDLSDSVSTHEYKIENITERTYGLSAFTSDPVVATWYAKPFIQLLVEWILSNIVTIAVITQVAIVLLIVLMRERNKKCASA